MSVKKDEERGTFYCEFRYRDHMNISRRKKKRGFKTKKEAKEWEINFLAAATLKAENIVFKELSRLYMEDVKNRIKMSTYTRKEKIINDKLNSFFGEMLIGNISPLVVRNWQNKELKNNYKKSYFLTIQKELNAIFNYASKFYNLRENPLKKAGLVHDSPLLQEKEEIKIWSPEEFNTFSENISDIEMYTIFNLLYYSGARIGEILALNLKDIDLYTGTLKITKSYQKIKKKEYITPPKSKSSIRIVKIPVFLSEIIKKYINNLYEPDSMQRIFLASRTNIHRCKNNTVKKLGLKNIRLHDFRHSHASLLINEGINIVAISKRLGHESIKITLDTYSHLMDGSEDKLISVLDKVKQSI